MRTPPHKVPSSEPAVVFPDPPQFFVKLRESLVSAAARVVLARLGGRSDRSGGGPIQTEQLPEILDHIVREVVQVGLQKIHAPEVAQEPSQRMEVLGRDAALDGPP